MLLCPVCKIVLKNTLRNGVSIDSCPQCRGIWLDRNELDKIIERSAKRRGESDTKKILWRIRLPKPKATRVYPPPPDEASQLYLEELFDEDD